MFGVFGINFDFEIYLVVFGLLMVEFFVIVWNFYEWNVVFVDVMFEFLFEDVKYVLGIM